MNILDASMSQLWAELKAKAVRELGRDGWAEWVEFAAKQSRLEAKREVIELKPLKPLERAS